MKIGKTASRSRPYPWAAQTRAWEDEHRKAIHKHVVAFMQEQAEAQEPSNLQHRLEVELRRLFRMSQMEEE